jgi:hypothetical protein
MTPIVLVDELVKFIESVVDEFELQSNVSGVKKSPQVVPGWLKEKKPNQQQDPPDFPYVIVRYIEDNDTGNGNLATVRIIAGTYSEDVQDGWRDCMNVLTRIKVALLKQPIVGKVFRVEHLIKTELPEEQPFPEWVAFMTLNVTMPSVQEEGGYFDAID